MVRVYCPHFMSEFCSGKALYWHLRRVHKNPHDEAYVSVGFAFLAMEKEREKNGLQSS